MKASYNWIRELVPGLAASPDEVALRLTAAGVEVEAFVSSHAAALPEQLRSRSGLVVHPPRTRWHYDRWYSRADMP
ncbi:MAG: hypothetical protein ABIT36_11080, partial [Steroidobacteraceae bacterium]